MARILIIDDDDSFREALAEAIRDLGHDPLLAKVAQQALEFTSNADAAFLDLKMPNMSGIDSLRQAKQRFPSLCLRHLPIVPIPLRPSDSEPSIISPNRSDEGIWKGFSQRPCKSRQ